MSNAPTIAPLDERWAYLADGAEVAAAIARVARDGTLAELAGAVIALEIDDVEAALVALALVHVSGESILDDE
jgi:hypothetical protein